jgi:hypothetical protein
MMKGHRNCLIPVAFTALVLVSPVCSTAPRSGSRSPSLSEERGQSNPFLQRGDYPERFGLAIGHAFDSHQFSNPWIAVKGSDASLWFVGERFQSEHRFDRIYVHVTASQHVTTSITPYQFGPSDWASLGPLFVDFRPEAELIAGQITKELSCDRALPKPEVIEEAQSL